MIRFKRDVVMGGCRKLPCCFKGKESNFFNSSPLRHKKIDRCQNRHGFLNVSPLLTDIFYRGVSRPLWWAAWRRRVHVAVGFIILQGPHQRTEVLSGSYVSRVITIVRIVQMIDLP